MCAEMKMRTCSKCNEKKPGTSEFFYKTKVNASGEVLLKGRCKPCCKPAPEVKRAEAKRYYQRNRESILKKNMVKYVKERHGIALAY